LLAHQSACNIDQQGVCAAGLLAIAERLGIIAAPLLIEVSKAGPGADGLVGASLLGQSGTIGPIAVVASASFVGIDQAMSACFAWRRCHCPRSLSRLSRRAGRRQRPGRCCASCSRAALPPTPSGYCSTP